MSPTSTTSNTSTPSIDDRCRRAREGVSLEFDHESPSTYGLAPDDLAAARDHVAGCASCSAFMARLQAIRHDVRFEALGTAPDVSGRVSAILAAAPRPAPEPAQPEAAEPDRAHAARPVSARPSRRTWVATALAAAACFVVGVLVGTQLVAGQGGGPAPAAAGVVERVAAAQRSLRSLDAGLEVHETGWQVAVPSRSYTGHLSFAAPESLAISLRDTTAYPSTAWVPNDIDLVVHGDRSWSRGLRECTTPVVPSCATGAPHTTAVEHREPFDDGSVAPLDLLVPTRSFARADEPPGLGTRVIDGRPAIGVVTTAAQAGALLDGWRPAGNGRSFFPTDRVELWLDDAALVPLSIRVIAGDGEDRRVWAATHGYTDRSGDAVLTVDLRGLAVDTAVAPSAFTAAPPTDAVVDDAGFRDGLEAGDRAAAISAAPPTGFMPVRAGTTGTGTDHEVVVRSWAQGRAWLKLEVTDRWTDHRMFGAFGAAGAVGGGGEDVVRPVALRDGSPAFASASGSTIAVHGDGIDLVVAGSVAPDDLVAFASTLGVAGRPLPADWSEAATATAADVSRLLPHVLVPQRPPGFASPVFRIDVTVVTARYVGAGDRAFTLVASAGEQLGPPLDMSVRGLAVRGGAARYSSDRGELEWVEDHVVYDLRSSTLALDQLLTITQTMAPP